MSTTDVCYAAFGLFSLAVFAAFGVYGIVRFFRWMRGGLKFGTAKTVGVVLFAVGAIAATISAQKTEKVGINLTLTNIDAKGFDLSWNYGTNRVDTSKVMTFVLRSAFSTNDVHMFTARANVTNIHVNATARGLPPDWMSKTWYLTVRAYEEGGGNPLEGSTMLFQQRPRGGSQE